MGVVPEALVEAVVKDVSERLADPSYGQVAVGSFVAAQPHVARFLSAQGGALGGEGVVHAAFHGELIREALERHLGGPPKVASFRDLDATAGDGAMKRFSAVQPALASYLASNVDDEALRELVAHVALAICR
ncbi:MAG: hypothetical protein H6721_01245 [Sandaracinus sp.]|nr:hypothetical protein [Sandaracinus sp.]MCB9630768.1 hypothetical protein [Sandaracinus sp.]